MKNDITNNHSLISKTNEIKDRCTFTLLDELELSVRSYNCLRRANINIVDDLWDITIGDLLKVKNMTQKSFEEITHKLAQHFFDS